MFNCTVFSVLGKRLKTRICTIGNCGRNLFFPSSKELTFSSLSQYKRCFPPILINVTSLLEIGLAVQLQLRLPDESQREISAFSLFFFFVVRYVWWVLFVFFDAANSGNKSCTCCSNAKRKSPSLSKCC